ncbi:hypothetical protein [Halosegnis longus]|uniref:hypothetical protein n=1 Tax=Halosegnis longus TaxID=2216012 RepID=UPI00129E9CD9|nr:hypothetical protein [Halosegnis longus]
MSDETHPTDSEGEVQQSEQPADDAYRYEADGKTVELSEGDTWEITARSGSGLYKKRYKVYHIGEDGINYTMSFEGNFDHRHRDDPTLFGIQPVEKGDARYVDTSAGEDGGDV